MWHNWMKTLPMRMLREVYFFCGYSFSKSRNIDYCPHCKAERMIFNDEKKNWRIEEAAVYVLGGSYNNGKYGFLDDWEKQ